jgi:hypothetical protein
MRTTLSESIHYLIVQLLSVEGMRDGQVDQQLADFAPMLALFVSKNMEDERFRISEVV